MAGAGVLLEFDYSFIESEFGEDEFGVWIIDPGTGGSLGGDYEFFLDASGSGTISFDLTDLDGMTGLGLQFQLSALPGDADYTSTLEIGNLRIGPAPEIIPEPSTLALLAVGLFGVVVRRRFER